MVSAVVIIVVIGVALVAGGDGGGGRTESPKTEVAEVQSDFQVRREMAEVWAGLGDVDTLPKLNNENWHGFPAGGLVTTDDNGEGWVQISDCMLVYVFQSSRLQKAACPKSDYTGGNVVCAIEGTSAFNNSCASEVVIQTPSADLKLEGTWVAVSYLPERQLTLAIVLEGKVEVFPVLDFESRELGEPTSVAGQEFLYTAPDDVLEQIGSVPARTPVSVDQLEPVIEALGIQPWMERVQQRAEGDGKSLQPGSVEVEECFYEVVTARGKVVEVTESSVVVETTEVLEGNLPTNKVDIFDMPSDVSVEVGTMVEVRGYKYIQLLGPDHLQVIFIEGDGCTDGYLQVLEP